MRSALPLVGAGGEPIDFYRTIRSHGVASLAPTSLDLENQTLSTVLRIGDRRIGIEVRARDKAMQISTESSVNARERRAILALVRRMFRLDDDLAPFYRVISSDPLLGWAAHGAGRMLASPSVFEDVIKTICTTNCAWSGTIRMTNALVELGGGAFPSAEELVATPASWFRDVAKMGYRGPYVTAIARAVTSEKLDLESMLVPFGKSDEDVEALLLDLPGIGPYGAAHIMQLLGRHKRLVLDSWTRPTYLRLAQKKQATDRTIARAFSRYGTYAGLAFWLFLTREWEQTKEPPSC